MNDVAMNNVAMNNVARKQISAECRGKTHSCKCNPSGAGSSAQATLAHANRSTSVNYAYRLPGHLAPPHPKKGAERGEGIVGFTAYGLHEVDEPKAIVAIARWICTSSVDDHGARCFRAYAMAYQPTSQGFKTPQPSSHVFVFDQELRHSHVPSDRQP